MNEIFYFQVGRKKFSTLKQIKNNKVLYLLYSTCKFGRYSLCITEEDYNNIGNKDIQAKVAKLWANAYL